MSLLDLYKSRFGAAVKQQGNGWNGPCPLCGGEPGTSDRFVVWPERDENLGETCATHRLTGIWSCRQCGRSGDTIAYLMQIDGMDFKAALAELGVEGGRIAHRRRAAPQEPRQQGTAFAPRVWPAPSALWQTYAAKLLDEATTRISATPQALSWLAARGITAEAVAAYHIGYLPAEGNKFPGRWRYRSALGLAPKQGDDGRIREKIFIPRGIVIPTFGPDGTLLNLRIRRHKEDLQPLPNGRKPSKYMELEGSCKAPMLLRSTSPAHLAAYFVTEAELDAMLIHHATGGVVGAVAVRTNRGKPDAATHERLSVAVRVCVALDYDAEMDSQGREHLSADAPGTQGLDWWEAHYPQYLRWPTPEGKDPGDAFRLGVDIREWVALALPESIALPAVSQHDHQGGGTARHLHGRMDACAAGLLSGGGGARPESPLPERNGPSGLIQTRTKVDECQQDGGEPRSASATTGRTGERHGEVAPAAHAGALSCDDLASLQSAVPAYLQLADIPLDVARAYLLWRGVPASFSKTRDALGNSTGFSWDYDPTWRHTHEAAFETFWNFQDSSQELWDWMSLHDDMTITARNLLRIWG